MRRTILSITCFAVLFAARTQPIRYPDLVYNPQIRSAEVVKLGAELAPPIIELGKEMLRVRFDDLSGETKNYSYSITYCTYDWQQSDLLFMQYATGFEVMDIFDFDVSNNTTTPYVHYWFDLPNQYIKLERSGNYIVKVFPSGEPEKVIFTRRFMVLEPLLTITPKVRAPSIVEYRNSGQEIYMSINAQVLNIQDYSNDIKVNILQNNRWDNAIIGLKPQYINGRILDYNYMTGETVFESGNQWRFLDLKTIQLAIPPVRKILFDKGRYNALVDMDVSRASLSYNSLGDINGGMAIYSQDYDQLNIDPDYANIYFSLPSPFPLDNGDVYVIGGFTFGALLPEYKMTYNEKYNTYDLVTTLKQGYYNYMYVYVPKNGKVGETKWLEGNFRETENNYTVLVYVRQPGDLQHRLIGYKLINSLTDR